MLLVDPPSRRQGTSTWRKWHLPWLLVCLLVATAGGAWYVIAAFALGALPGGSSLPGLVAGIAGGLLFFYLFAYGLRKLVPFRWWFRLRPTKFWLAQHIWFGLLTFPLVAMHSGLLTRWGGILTMLLLLIYFAVIVSGIWGLWMQQSIPRLMLQEVPEEANFYQLGELTEQLRREADLLVFAACGPEAGLGKDELALLQSHQDILQAVRKGKGSGILRDIPRHPLPDTEPLRQYFRQEVEPYLRRSTLKRGSAGAHARMKAEFGDLRKMIHREALPVVDTLEALCDHRRQFDEQTQLHLRLHNWIVVHQALSAILLLFLAFHVVSAVWYW